jgi:excisionase family DNA binding protein
MSNIPFAQRLACTIDEACRATGIGRTKLYEEISAGRIESVTIGKRRLVLVPSLLRLLGSEGTPKSAPHAPEVA